jgi:tRNA 2-thiouridine synthesizing protein C
MKTIFYLLEIAPYGSEKAYGALNAAIVSMKTGVTVGLYGDGVYLSLARQDSRALRVPNLSDLIYAYPELKVIAHEPSLLERGLLVEKLIENIELADEADFLAAMESSNSVIIL